MPTDRPPSRGSAPSPIHPLAAYGWSDSVAAALSALASGEPGRVVRADRGRCLVVTGSGAEHCRIPGRLDEPGRDDRPPTTGDWVLVRQQTGAEPAIAAVAPRRSAIVRNDPADTGYQVLAANVDTVLVLIGLDRPEPIGRLERLLVVVWNGGATPVVVLTKTDLCDDEEVSRRLATAAAASSGAEVIAISSVTGGGLGELDRHLGLGATVALVGESGSGKSTLVNRLLGVEVMATGETRRDHKGRHTTTTRELTPLPGGAVLMDTPGLRAVGLWQGEVGLERVFADIEGLAAGCRFRNCRHSTEPGCAVAAAVAAGTLDERRLASYRKLLREQAYVAARSDVRIGRAAARAAGRRYRSATKRRRPR